MTRDKYIKIRVTEGEAEYFHNVAEHAHMTVSEMVRRVVSALAVGGPAIKVEVISETEARKRGMLK
jgi:hypothetical protein